MKVVLCIALRRAFYFGALKDVIRIEKDEKKKVRRKAWILLIAVILAFLIPMRTQYKDGGTVRYKAMLYSVTKWHELAVENHRPGAKTGITVRILRWDVYDSTEFVPDDIETTLSPAGGTS